MLGSVQRARGAVLLMARRASATGRMHGRIAYGLKLFAPSPIPSAGEALHSLERDRGVAVRFVVGYSNQKGDPNEAIIAEEAAAHGDILRLDMVDLFSGACVRT
jgi:hypothetical protein